jgi:biopolymer transport protein ExbD
LTIKLPQSSSGAINMTPIIDVVFLLLIFFLVATKMEEEERQLQLTLPEASEAQPVSRQPQEIVVNVSQGGIYVVGGNVLELTQLESTLRQAAANNPGTQAVIIRGDAKTPLENVMAVMNSCIRAGIRDYRLAAAEK